MTKNQRYLIIISFLYLVKAQLNGRNYFNIYPRKNEIWVLCKEQDAECTFADMDAGDYDIVEVGENNGDIVKVLPLTHVAGYKTVFKVVDDRVVEIPIDESHRFFYQVRAVRLTDEQVGRLRGFWELDLAQFLGDLGDFSVLHTLHSNGRFLDLVLIIYELKKIQMCLWVTCLTRFSPVSNTHLRVLYKV
ncbi:hypothetical protein HanRHA438_Chr08g0334601 [Helianthus annuus]|uniref:DUF3444 domain-containing protein n=1 Tax=Helianthus annuus TaxID=4232 RepID=A0A9K3IC72_HELAN|nr:hypothetical protein HanXRQr2_Chr08g0323471 [Helianthus annuus]KAJ0552332.1 hypothetical protein HanHA89_Chr08g0284081 [Helianthus annuus]KAJ0718031.1 hypothetical protein HanLR1_Chr08g0266161 [Helianthus annuus]KAJ0896430.1 hypothetical protein HanRHA438_Chr08g0334601 [Helianthus annuus]